MERQRKPYRPVMAARVSAAGQQYIATLAAERGEPVGATMRTMLAYASANMPRTWQPR